MAIKFVQPGDVLELTAPSGGVTVDVPALIGNLFGVPAVTAAAAAKFNHHLMGVWTLPKATGAATEGQKAYWDLKNGKVTTDPTGGLYIGEFAAAAASGDTTASVRFAGAISEDGVSVFSLTAPTGGVTKGTPVLIDNIFCIPMEDADAAAAFKAKVGGPATLAKAAVDVTEGDKAYWDIENACLTNDPTGALYVGEFLADAASGTGTVLIHLRGSIHEDGVSIISLTAPAGGVTKGTGYITGNIFAVAMEDAAESASYRAKVGGIALLPKNTSLATTQGDLMYWDVADAELNKTSTDNYPVGAALTTELAATATQLILLDGTATEAAA